MRRTLREAKKQLWEKAAMDFYKYAIKRIVLTVLGLLALNIAIVGYWVPTYLPAPACGGGPGWFIDFMVLVWSGAVLGVSITDIRAYKKDAQREARRNEMRLRQYYRRR